MDKNFKEQLREVKAFAFDIDGVLTDGSLLILENGETARSFHVRDSYALRRAADAGFTIAIISYARSEDLRTRFKAIGVKEVYLSCSNKVEALEELCLAYDLQEKEVLYMGDDTPDMAAMLRCGAATCPSDAAHEVKAISVYVSPFAGGKGCVRDVIEQVMRVQGKWNK